MSRSTFNKDKSKQANFSKDTISTDTPTGRNELFEQIFAAAKEEEKNYPDEKTLYTNIKNLLSRGNIVDAIDQLHLAKDASNGIHSRYETIDGQTVLLRDAREQKDYNESFHSWAIIGLSYLNAVKKLVAAHDKELTRADERQLNVIASTFFENTRWSKDPEIELGRMIHSTIIPFLTKKLGISKEKAEKQLANVRDFGNFDHPTMSVATITKVDIVQSLQQDKDHIDVIQIDIPMCGMIDDTLKDEYERLANKDNEEEDLQDIAWYQQQSDYIKKLIRAHAQDILDGKMIPTQLRKYFPGIRNAGEERVFDLEDKSIDTSLYSGYHAGNPGHLLGDKQANQTATTQAVGQLSRLIGAKHLNIQTLLSPVNRGFSDDADLATQVSTAVKENSGSNDQKESIVHSNTALNAWRSAGFNTVTNLMNAVFRTKLEPNFKIIGADFIWAEAKLLKEKDYYDAKDPLFKKLQVALQEYENLRAGSRIFDAENANLSLVSAIKVVAHFANQIYKQHEHQENDFLAQIDPCQSGKDRQGLARIKAINDSVMLHITGTISPGNDADLQAQEQNIRRALAKSGQVRLQAGLQGGTLGAEGIKKDTQGAVPVSYQQDKANTPIIEATASYNKKLPKNPDKKKRWYKNKKFWLGVAGVAIGIALCATVFGMIAGIPLAATGVTVTVGAISVGIGAAQLKKAKKDNDIASRASKLSKNYYHIADHKPQTNRQKGHEEDRQHRDNNNPSQEPFLSPRKRRDSTASIISNISDDNTSEISDYVPPNNIRLKNAANNATQGGNEEEEDKNDNKHSTHDDEDNRHNPPTPRRLSK